MQAFVKVGNQTQYSSSLKRRMPGKKALNILYLIIKRVSDNKVEGKRTTCSVY